MADSETACSLRPQTCAGRTCAAPWRVHTTPEWQRGQGPKCCQTVVALSTVVALQLAGRFTSRQASVERCGTTIAPGPRIFADLRAHLRQFGSKEARPQTVADIRAYAATNNVMHDENAPLATLALQVNRHFSRNVRRRTLVATQYLGDADIAGLGSVLALKGRKDYINQVRPPRDSNEGWVSIVCVVANISSGYTS
eukprot:5109965-Prymnesium_polylepis.1